MHVKIIIIYKIILVLTASNCDGQYLLHMYECINDFITETTSNGCAKPFSVLNTLLLHTFIHSKPRGFYDTSVLQDIA